MADVYSVVQNILNNQIPSILINNPDYGFVRQNPRTPKLTITSNLIVSIVRDASSKIGQNKIYNATALTESITTFTNETWTVHLICKTASNQLNQAITTTNTICNALISTYSQQQQLANGIYIARNPQITDVSFGEGAEMITDMAITYKIKNSDTLTNTIDFITTVTPQIYPQQ